MRNLTMLLMVLVLTVFAANAQIVPDQNQDLKDKTITAQFNVGDVVFAYNSLSTINIQGNEVDAFLEVKNELKKFTDEIESSQKKIDENISITMNVLVANNLMIFLQRVTLQGANAERYQRFKNTMLDAAKKLQQ
jgi:hypothetical protein